MEDEKDPLDEYNGEKRILEYNVPLFQKKLREIVLFTWEGLVYDAHDENKKIHQVFGSVIHRKDQLRAYSREVENLTTKYSESLSQIDNSNTSIEYKIQMLKDLEEELRNDNMTLTFNIKALTFTKVVQ